MELLKEFQALRNAWKPSEMPLEVKDVWKDLEGDFGEAWPRKAPRNDPPKLVVTKSAKKWVANSKGADILR